MRYSPEILTKKNDDSAFSKFLKRTEDEDSLRGEKAKKAK